MAIATDQVGQNSSSTSTSSGTVTLPSAAANTLIIFAVSVDDPGTVQTFATPTATGLTFVQIGATLRDVNNFDLAIWRAYTSSPLGSTVISESWTTGNDWVMQVASFTGTAGTAGNNGSDAIGNTNTATGTNAAATVTVASSSHNLSQYYGAITEGSTPSETITKGANYSVVNAYLFDGNFQGMLTELSTSPVTPAGATIVNGTLASSPNGAWGIFGVELLAGASGVAPSLLVCPIVWG